jgi:hypothetical protein
MNTRFKGLLLGAIQLAMVLSLGGKLLYDRMTCPRVWVQAHAYDPDLPIRGRYLSEQLQMPAVGFRDSSIGSNPKRDSINLEFFAPYEVRDGQLVAIDKESIDGPGGLVVLSAGAGGEMRATASEPVLFFIPDNADLTQVKPRADIWVEVTLPKKGPPRPIRIGVKKDGVITPLHFN